MAKQYYTLDELVYTEKPVDGRFKDIEGKLFGRLTVLGFAGSHNGKKLWFCSCCCGRIIRAESFNLRNDNTTSCGCAQAERARDKNTTHGASATKENNIYRKIKERCNNKNSISYPLYGGRGIKLLLSFEEFLKEVGSRPSSKHSIDRVDNARHYEKGNLRWATLNEQANNKRNNVVLILDGVSKTCTEWAKEKSINPGTIKRRKKFGWCDKHAISEALMSKKPKDCPDCNKSKC